MVSSPSKQSPAQSPWKRPKTVSLVRTVAGRSMKRKCEALEALGSGASSGASLSPSNKSLSSQSLNEDANHAQCTPSDLADSPKKIRRLGFNNRFSINSANLSMDQSPANRCSSENDLGSFFFSGRRDSSTFNDSNISFNMDNKKSENRMSGITPEIVQNICSSLLSASSSSEIAKSVENKVEYQYEDECLLPIDWSIKSKLRIVSTRKIACVEEIKSQHEADANWNFCVFNNFYSSLDKKDLMTPKERNDLFKTLFCESTSYWICPYLPWVNLYPRTTMSVKPELMLADEAQKSLLKSWNTSFISLYNSLKNNKCPYFYMFTTTFTVLFKSPSISQNGEMCAILTPTTKGLREAIQKENINFTMPLSSLAAAVNSTTSPNNRSGDLNQDCNSQLSDENTQHSVKFFIGNDDQSSDKECKENIPDEIEKKENKDDDDDDDDDDDEHDGDEEPDEWLEQIGLNNTVNFKSSVLQRNTKMSQKHSLNNFDQKPRSTLLFNQNIDVQALFNYLNNLFGKGNNTNNCGGVPPTLISPVTFLGATLHRHRTERKIIKTLNNQNEKVVHFCLDLAGPILPFHVNRLCHLLRATQAGEFEMVLNPNQQTVAFNSDRKVANNDELNINNTLLGRSESQSLSAQYGVYGECKSLRAIHCKDDKFCCVVE